jgi:O-antigen/teichoic acid export membrane protein
VKHFFDDKTTGFYAAAGILAKIVFSLALGSSGVLFPKVVELYSNGEEEEMVKNLHNTINIVLIPGVIITAVIALFPKVITKLFFGTQYDIGALLSIYSISLFFLAISVIFMMYDLAIQRFSHIPILMIAAIVLIHQISISHQTLYNIVWTLFVINASILVLFLFYNRREMMLYFNKVI